MDRKSIKRATLDAKSKVQGRVGGRGLARWGFGVWRFLRFAEICGEVPARRSSPAQRQGAADLKATASAADPYENSCWWILYCMLEVRVLWALWIYRWIARAVSMTRAAYDASFAKLVSLVACRDSRRYENQSIIRYFFYWLARFDFVNAVLTSLEFVCVRERLRNFYRQIINNTPRL